MRKQREQLPELERFEKYIFYSPDGCWYWTGGVSTYGMFSSNGKSVKAHRRSYELYKGSIDNGLCVMHICDNPLCVNPDHLRLGTFADNNNDRKNKGRNRNQNGKNHSNALLDNLSVLVIKEARNHGFKLKEIADYFHVSFGHVSQICLNKRWKYDISA